jgi:hypothetical protein
VKKVIADISFDETIRVAILRITALRGSSKSVCLSEVAKSVAPQGWRPLMPDVRRMAIELVRKGRIVALQQGDFIDLTTARGPYRLAEIAR